MIYDPAIIEELRLWEKKMTRRPSVAGYLSKAVQNRINRIIPEQVHKAVTTAIKQMVRGVLFGAGYIGKTYPPPSSLTEREMLVEQRIKFYQTAAATEGGITGAGGILLGLADFPLLLGFKLKMLFDIAGMYGFDASDYRERVYLLHIFELAFSSQQHRKLVFEKMRDWDQKKTTLPEDVHAFDWRSFQQEYRDYIDLAKMAQLVPGIGAVVGVVVNYRLLRQLGDTARNAYRMRLLPQA
ncbi:EcsC protein family protein [Cnuella takakiae]|uniref:EcsC protein family protein n=1 Tax=Cnuella takakiae TaxID=1302690 RepID=A0A1M5BMY6_9BACT|nr:EcsC family protein [Cnuella takakiae]OLY93450.1 ABC transporter-associated protein EcsC [Cnuella takakiae]SHF43879.1 EcsC protein family protein [Cnuella takakiae]